MPKGQLTPEQEARLAKMDDAAQDADAQLKEYIAKATPQELLAVIRISQWYQDNYLAAGYTRLTHKLWATTAAVQARIAQLGAQQADK